MVSFCSGGPSQKDFAGSSELVSQCIEHGNQYPVGIESPIFVFSAPFWASFSLHVMMTEQENKESVSLSLYRLYQIFSFYRTCSISFISPFLLSTIQPIFDYFRLSLKPDRCLFAARYHSPPSLFLLAFQTAGMDEVEVK